MTRSFPLSIDWSGYRPPEDSFERIDSRMRELAALLLPRWVERVWLYWVYDDESPARVQVQEDYRTIRITLNPKVLAENAREFDRTLIHELMHAYNVPVCDAAELALQDGGKEGLQDAVSRPLRETLERMNCDLADLICRLLE